MPRVGALAAFVAYLALLVGFLLIGQPAQYQAVIPGLWFTEAMTIALPAVFTLLVLGVALAPYLGFRRLSWKAALIAVAAAAANQPIVSFLTWMSRLALPADWVAKFDTQQRAINQIFEVHGAAFALTVTIAAPLGEEIFFRGFAFPAVSKSWGLPAAIVVSGAAFSFIHLDAVGSSGGGRSESCSPRCACGADRSGPPSSATRATTASPAGPSCSACRPRTRSRRAG